MLAGTDGQTKRRLYPFWEHNKTIYVIRRCIERPRETEQKQEREKERERERERERDEIDR